MKRFREYRPRWPHLIVVLAVGVAGCGGGDVDKSASKPAAEPAATATAPAEPPPEATAPPAADLYTVQEVRAAFDKEGIETNEVKPAEGIVDPTPEATVSLISPKTGTVAHGGVNFYKTAAEAGKASDNAKEEFGGDLEFVVLGNLLITQDPEPFRGFPTAAEMATIVRG